MKWSEDDIDYLILACQDGESTKAEVAEFLGRSVHSINRKLRLLRLTGDYPGLYWGKAKRDEQNAFIKRFYRKMPTSEIAEKLGITETAVWNRAKRLGLIQPNVLTVEKVTALAEQGLTRDEIAKELGTGYNNVRTFIQRHKIPCVRKKRVAFRVKLN